MQGNAFSIALRICRRMARRAATTNWGLDTLSLLAALEFCKRRVAGFVYADRSTISGCGEVYVTTSLSPFPLSPSCPPLLFLSTTGAEARRRCGPAFVGGQPSRPLHPHLRPFFATALGAWERLVSLRVGAHPEAEMPSSSLHQLGRYDLVLATAKA